MWLVLVSLLLWVVFGLLGLIIDLGQVRVSQDAMQNAVESAALEGVWGTAGGEVSRRTDAAQFVRWTFDDDFEVTAGDVFQHGAGGDVELSDGTGDIDAGVLVTVGDPPVYRPTPELNLPNAAYGDMVAGQFTYGMGLPADPLRLERADYTREDFTPDLVAPDAFLVRLRRTNDPDGLDAVAGESSRGRPLPWLFARGSTLAPEARARGVATRATAIAAGRPALAVGPADDCFAPSRLGCAPFALTAAAWNARVAGDVLALDETATGELADADSVIGRVLACPTLRAVGEVTASTGAPLAGVIAADSVFYLPVYDTGLANRIVGFGRVRVVSHAGGVLTLEILAGGVAASNASAVMVDGLVGLDAPTVNALLAAGRGLSEGLRAPALVR